MKLPFRLVLFFFVGVITTYCSQKTYRSNGERIYKTGKNYAGVVLLDKTNSQLHFVKSCQTCHGKRGSRNRNCKIGWSYLSSVDQMDVPYTDSLFFRFLEEDLKSNGQKALTGVHWKMSPQDKADLLAYIKSLK